METMTWRISGARVRTEGSAVCLWPVSKMRETHNFPEIKQCYINCCLSRTLMFM